MTIFKYPTSSEGLTVGGGGGGGGKKKEQEDEKVEEEEGEEERLTYGKERRIQRRNKGDKYEKGKEKEDESIKREMKGKGSKDRERRG